MASRWFDSFCGAIQCGCGLVNVWGKRFRVPQLTHESFLTIDHSCKIFFWYLSNWTSTDLWCVVLYVTYSTTHQRPVEVKFGRYQKNILQESSMVTKLSCVSCGSLKRLPHTFTIKRVYQRNHLLRIPVNLLVESHNFLENYQSMCPHKLL